jgi:hypothetical protein
MKLAVNVTDLPPVLIYAPMSAFRPHQAGGDGGGQNLPQTSWGFDAKHRASPVWRHDNADSALIVDDSS